MVAFVLPLIFLLLFGYGITLDPRVQPLTLLDRGGGPRALSLTSEFAHSPWFAVGVAGDANEAARLLSDSETRGVIILKADFDRRLDAGAAAEIQLLVDGGEPNGAQYVRNYAQGLIKSWTASLYPGGVAPAAPINVQPRYWYNPDAKSEKFLVPGSITVIMTLIGVLLTSLVFAREWERGTLEALLATPVTKTQILLGKLIPYFTLAMAALFLCVFLSVSLFEIPARGSWGALLILASVFTLCALGHGLLISICLKGQLVAAEAGLFTGFLPALLLSGFVFDIESMAPPLRILSNILPATHFNTCVRTWFLAGDFWTVFTPALLYMGALAAILLTLVYLKIPRRLPKS